MQKYLKAFYASAVAFVGALELALIDDVVITQEWAHIGGVTLAAFAVVWAVPNKGRS